MDSPITQVLLTGATGFIGRSLYPVLIERGYRVIGATRNPENASRHLPGREFRRMEATDVDSVREAMKGCQAAIYLIHGMAGGTGYVEVERRSAESFCEAAEQAGLSRIVYFGAMHPSGALSRHLRSRFETGVVFRAGKVKTIELQGAMVIGAGSESWCIVRDLAARLPFMVLPRWLDNRSQPIALRDVTFALAESVTVPLPHSRALPLPGAELLSGREILMRTARLLGMHPLAIRVPCVTPHLSSYWIRLVTRADRHVAEELVQGLLSDLVVDSDGFWQLFPNHRRLPFDEAADLALRADQHSLSLAARVVEHLIRMVSPGSSNPNRIHR